MIIVVMVTALVVVSTGSMASFTITGSIDGMDSDAAISLNTTANTFTSLPLVLVVVCVIAIVVMCMVSRNAF